MHNRLVADLCNLSIQHVTGHRKPSTPSNEVRFKRYLLAAAAHRAEQPSPTANDHQWSFRETFPRPALASLPNPSRGRVQGLYDNDPPSADDVREAYRFKYDF